MGLLNFTKKSRKAGRSNNEDPFSLSSHHTQQDAYSRSSIVGNPNTNLKNEFSIIDSPMLDYAGVSLMDDIMNELGTAKGQTSMANFIDTAPAEASIYNSNHSPFPDLTQKQSNTTTLENPAFSSFEQYALERNKPTRTDNQNVQQSQKAVLPKPLISFNSESNSANNKANNYQDSNANHAIMHNDMSNTYRQSALQDVKKPSYSQENANKESIASRAPIHQQFSNTLPASTEILNVSAASGSPKPTNTTPPSSTLSNYIKPNTTTTTTPSSSTPAFNHTSLSIPSATATNNNPPAANENLTSRPSSPMDRMKERHRLEVRRTLNTPSFSDNTPQQKMIRHNLSSPSMPMMLSAAHSGELPVLKPTPPRQIVQSHSFSNYTRPIVGINSKRPMGQLVRSASSVMDAYVNTNIGNGSMGSTNPIQTQSDISLMPRSRSSLVNRTSQPVSGAVKKRNSYLQPGAQAYSPTTASFQNQDSTIAEEENTVPVDFLEDRRSAKSGQLSRSVSAYPAFTKQPSILLLQHEKQKQALLQQHQEWQQQQYFLQQQKEQQQNILIQQQIELEKQQQIQQFLEIQQQQQTQQQIELQLQQLAQQKQRQEQQQLQLLQQKHFISQTISEIAAPPPQPLLVGRVVPSLTHHHHHHHDEEDFIAEKKPRPLYERAASPINKSTCPHRSISYSHAKRDSNDQSKIQEIDQSESSKVISETNSSSAASTTEHATSGTSPDNTDHASSAEEEETNVFTVKEPLLSNSSTSTLTEDFPTLPTAEEGKVESAAQKINRQPILLPKKLKHELQSMQLRRSPYSVPDLSAFLKDEEESKVDDKKWDTVQLFGEQNNSAISANETIVSLLESDIQKQQQMMALSKTVPGCHICSSYNFPPSTGFYNLTGGSNDLCCQSALSVQHGTNLRCSHQSSRCSSSGRHHHKSSGGCCSSSRAAACGSSSDIRKSCSIYSMGNAPSTIIDSSGSGKGHQCGCSKKHHHSSRNRHSHQHHHSRRCRDSKLYTSANNEQLTSGSLE